MNAATAMKDFERMGRRRMLKRISLEVDGCNSLCGRPVAQPWLQGDSQAPPVVGADEPVPLAQLGVPRMADRRAGDPVLARPDQVDRGVVDEDVDAELDAARDLVVGAVEVVIGKP